MDAVDGAVAEPVAAGAAKPASGGDEDEICAVCWDGDSDESNPIVFCDGCDLAVHASCIGFPLVAGVPSGEWQCMLCQWRAHGSKCVLCAQTGGAMKRTVDSQWCHLCCAMWIPEVFFLDGEGREPIDYFRVPQRRFEKTCKYCKTREGAVMECSEGGCSTHFHVTCGLQRGVLLEYKESTRKREPDIIVAFCATHAEAARRKQHWKMKFYAKA